jgi:hypothetical protein
MIKIIPTFAARKRGKKNAERGLKTTKSGT